MLCIIGEKNVIVRKTFGLFVAFSQHIVMSIWPHEGSVTECKATFEYNYSRYNSGGVETDFHNPPTQTLFQSSCLLIHLICWENNWQTFSFESAKLQVRWSEVMFPFFLSVRRLLRWKDGRRVLLWEFRGGLVWRQLQVLRTCGGVLQHCENLLPSRSYMKTFFRKQSSYQDKM